MSRRSGYRFCDHNMLCVPESGHPPPFVSTGKRLYGSASGVEDLNARTTKKAAGAQREMRQTAAILKHWREDVPQDRLGLLVKDAIRSYQRAMQLRLTEHSVSFGHWTFLRVLWQNDGITQRALSEQAGVMEPTTFSALKAMERLGYVTRRQLHNNRKNVYIHLTESGRALKDKLVPLAIEINDLAVAGVPAADVATTRRTLLMIIENLAADEARLASHERRMPSTRNLAGIVAGGAPKPR